MRCEEAEQLLEARRDLSFAEERALQRHLAGCTQCALAARRAAQTTRLLQSLPRNSAHLSAERAAAMRARLERPARMRFWRLPLLIGAAVCALLLGLLVTDLPNVPATTTLSSANNPRVPLPRSLYLLSQSENEITISIRDLQSLAERSAIRLDLADIPGADHQSAASSYQLLPSPDGETLYLAIQDEHNGLSLLLAYQTSDGSLLWHSAFQSQVNNMLGIEYNSLRLAINGSRLYFHQPAPAYSGMIDYPVLMIDTADGNLLAERLELQPGASCLSPELITAPLAGRVFVNCHAGDLLQLDTASGTILKRLPVSYSSAHFSSDWRRLMVVSLDLRVALIDSLHGTLLREIELDPGGYFLYDPPLLAFSGDGRRMLAGRITRDQRTRELITLLRVYDTRDWHELARFQIAEPLYRLSFDADGRRILAIGADDTAAGLKQNNGLPVLLLIDAETGELHAQEPLGNAPILEMQVGP